MKPFIEMIQYDIHQELVDGILKAVQKVDIKVDEKRLMQALTDAKAFYDEGYADGRREAVKWIPVEEIMPRAYVSVFGCMAGDVPQVRECFLVGERMFFFPALRECHPITHWMPLPAPPKEGE